MEDGSGYSGDVELIFVNTETGETKSTQHIKNVIVNTGKSFIANRSCNQSDYYNARIAGIGLSEYPSASVAVDTVYGTMFDDTTPLYDWEYTLAATYLTNSNTQMVASASFSGMGISYDGVYLADVPFTSIGLTATNSTTQILFSAIGIGSTAATWLLQDSLIIRWTISYTAF